MRLYYGKLAWCFDLPLDTWRAKLPWSVPHCVIVVSETPWIGELQAKSACITGPMANMYTLKALLLSCTCAAISRMYLHGTDFAKFVLLVILLCLFDVAIIVYFVGEDNCTGPAAAARLLACCGDEQSCQIRKVAVSRPQSLPFWTDHHLQWGTCGQETWQHYES